MNDEPFIRYNYKWDTKEMEAVVVTPGKDGQKRIHKVNVDHLLYEHAYNNKWID